ncbi:MAG: type II toxin-antitoxin system VapC family toxin [Terracidiphilus sp.]|jgi:predicted nucleic acid-binding protein
MVLIDTNVLVDVLERDPQWFDWSIGQVRKLSMTHPLAINAVIYAELASTYSSSAILDEKIAIMNLVFEPIPRTAAFLAGKAYVLYRRQGGTKSNVLADFFIGAHAAVLGCPLLTRNTRRYSAYFPTVRLIAP